MKIWADFYHYGCVSGDPISACGSDATIRLDARLQQSKHIKFARDWALKHGYIGFKLIRGSHLLQAKPYTNLAITNP